jgi:mannose-1-phosphate guanylyltransferase
VINQVEFRPIILAGGSGTRFWPRSRKARAKQILALDGERTMIQRTVDRLAPIAPASSVWVITNDLLSNTICGQLELIPEGQVVCEPSARNTAPAAGLAAFLVEKENPDAVLGMFPADHVIADEPGFLAVIERAIALAAAGETMVVLGVTPNRPETGYGYIETGEPMVAGGGVCRCGQLSLEVGDLYLVGADPRQCCARAFAGDLAAAGADCRGAWHAGV